LEAGNAKVGRFRLPGLNISVQFPAGVARKEGQTLLTRAYGHIRGTEAADGAQVDVFLGDRSDDLSLPVFVIDQVNADGKYDEAKVVMGEASEADARAAYLSNYPAGWSGMGAIKQLSHDEFRAWLADREATKKPLALKKRGPLKAEVEAREKARRTSPAELNDARPKAHLEKQVRVDGQVMTRRQFIEARIAAGDKPSVEMVDKVKPMSRMASFRATNEQQRAHEKKVREGGKVPEYSVGTYVVPKIEYDYAVSLATKAKPAGVAAPETLYHGGEWQGQGAIRVPAFFSEVAADAEWFSADRGGEVTPARVAITNALDLRERQGMLRLIELARGAGVQIDTDIAQDPPEGWSFNAPDIAKHSDYDGTNPVDLAYIPQVRAALQAAGYDGLALNDTIANAATPAWVALDAAQVTAQNPAAGASAVTQEVSDEGQEQAGQVLPAEQEGRQPEARPVERRADAEGRARVDAAPVDAKDAEIARLRRELDTDDLTTTKSAKAYRRDHPNAAAVVFIDINAFKGYNTKFTEAGGDVILAAFGRVLVEVAGDRAYRRGGDEFALLVESEEVGRALANAVYDEMKKVGLTLTDKNGDTWDVQGIPFRIGVGATDVEATRASALAKQSGDRLDNPNAIRVTDVAGGSGPDAGTVQRDGGDDAQRAEADAAAAAGEVTPPPAAPAKIRNFGWNAAKLSDLSRADLMALRAQVEAEHAYPTDANGSPIGPDGKHSLYRHDPKGRKKLDALAMAVYHQQQDATRARAAQATEVATHADPGEAPEAATPAVIADAARTAAAHPRVTMKQARDALLAKIDEALKTAPPADLAIEVGKAYQRDGLKTKDVTSGRTVNVDGTELRVPTLRVVERSNDRGYLIYHDNTKIAEKQGGWPRFELENLIRGARWSADGGPAGTWTFTAVEPEYITLDVPGDGTFKVINTRERLAAFRDQVAKQFRVREDATFNGGVTTRVSDAERAKVMAEAETVDEEAAQVETPAPAPLPPAARETPKPKVRMKAGKPVYDQTARETIEAYFQPGRIVNGYAGKDRVLKLSWNIVGSWLVQVERVNDDGVATEEPRWHSTPPDLRELIAVLGEPVAPVKATKAKGETATTPVPDAPADILTSTDALLDRLRDGNLTLDEFRAGFDAIAKPAEVRAALAKLSKPQLLDRASWTARPSDKKESLVASAYHRLIVNFNLGPSFGIQIGGDIDQSYLRAVRAWVEKATQADLDAFAESVKKDRAERAAKVAAVAEGLKDPKTVDDFTRYLRAKMESGVGFTDAYRTLTPEQRAQYDTLLASQSRAQRQGQKRERKTEVRTAGETTASEVIATKHTQKGHDLFVVQLGDRLSREDYDTLNASAKRLGGSYSSFRGRGAVPGFQFRTRDAAEAFRALVGGDTTAAKAQAEARRDAFDDDREQSAVQRLRTMADALDERAEESLSRDRKANTARRAGQAARAEAEARGQQAQAATMRKLADAIEAGNAAMLDQVRAKSQVELLTTILAGARNEELNTKFPYYGDREKHAGEPPTTDTASFATFPQFTLYRSDWAALARRMVVTDGLKLLGKRILTVADDVSKAYLDFAKANLIQLTRFTGTDGARPAFRTEDEAERSIVRSGYRDKAIPYQVKRGEWTVILSPTEARTRGLWKGDDDQRITIKADIGAEIVEKIGRANRRAPRGQRIDVPWSLDAAHDRRKALARIGIETPAELRAALREFVSLRQAPKAPDRVKELERAMVGRANDGMDFFPTSPSVVEDMLAAAEIEPGMRVLEPSAGMGHIADAIRDTGVEPEVGELSEARRELLEAKGYAVGGRDFLAQTEGGYDRIVMNPPFSNRRDAEHVQHAYGLLKPGGRVVAIMGEGVFFGQDKKAQAFRAWLDEVGGTSEKLPEGSFLDPSLPVNTGVNARMVVIDKPAGASDAAPAQSQPEASTGRGRLFSIGIGQNDLRRAIAQAMKGWQGDIPIVRVVQDARALPPVVRNSTGWERAEGWFDGQGTVYVVASNVPNLERGLQVLAHEAIGHYGIEGVMGRESWAGVVADVGRLRARTDLSPAVAGAMQSALRRYPDADPVTFAREFLAILAERGVRTGLLDRVLTAIRRFLKALGITADGRGFTEASLLALVGAGRRRVQDAGAPRRDARLLGAGASEQAPVFYSALLEAIQTGKGAPKKGDAAQWGGWLDGAVRRGEVKQAERDWLGVDAWLRERGSATRDELAAFVRDNQVQVRDMVLGEGQQEFALPENWRVEQEDDDEWVVFDADDVPIGTGSTRADAIINAQDIDEREDARQSGGVRFAEYQLPGGQNYRELLLTLPPKNPMRGVRFVFEDEGDVDDFLTDVAADGFEELDYGRLSDEPHVVAFDSLVPAQVIAMAERAGATMETDSQQANADPVFSSSHFPTTPNVLAHVRYNERTDADGKKVLFIEEIQSDWHQAGRKQGYVGADVNTLNEAKKEYEALMLRMTAVGLSNLSATDRARIEELRPIIRGQGSPTKGVPDAPFKATDEWAMLAFKRMVRHAAEQGFDRIAWTTGEQQAERYDLSKQVKEITYEKTERGYFVNVMALTGGNVLAKDLTESEVEETLGKDMLEKMRKSEGVHEGDRDPDLKGSYTLRGDGLKVGGEGMRGFYDNILPKAVNRWAKKFGGKVGNVTIARPGGVSSQDAYFVTNTSANDRPYPARDWHVATSENQVSTHATREEAYAEADRLNTLSRAEVRDTVHALDLTDAMRAAALDGLPQFSKADPTDSLAFKAWFGKSKVVDADGKPLVQYHGTNSEDFPGFTRSQDIGFHFGNAKQANDVAARKDGDGWRKYRRDEPDGGERVMPVYLSIKNPLRLPDLGEWHMVAILEELEKGGVLTKDERRALGERVSHAALNTEERWQAMRDAIEAKGYDGIVYLNKREGTTGGFRRVPSGDSYIAFRPEQVKSVFNRGTWDGNDPRMAFSMPDAAVEPGQVILSPRARLSVRDWFKLKLTDLKPAILSLVPMNYLADYAPQSMPAVKQYLDLRLQMDAMRTRLHQAYDAVAQEWLSFNLKDKPGARALADLMHDSTIVGVDPTLPASEYNGDAEKKARYTELRARYDALPEAGQALYAKVRDSYTAQVKLLEKTLEENLERATELQVARVNREYLKKARVVEFDADLDDAGRAQAMQELEFERNRRLAAANQSGRARTIALRQKFESMRVEAPYFPLKRFGRYSVAVRKDGRTVSFSKFENAADMERYTRERQAEGYDVAQWLDTDDALQTMRAVDPRFVADIEELLMGSDAPVPDGMLDAIWQRYLESLPDLSLRKSFIHRKKTPGYNPDALRAFSSGMFHGSYQIARAKYGAEMQDVLEVAQEQAEQHSPVQGAALVQELGKRHQWVMNPKGSRGAQLATSLAFIYHLGASPAHLLLNATQTVMLGVPMLGSRFGFDRAGKELLRAAADFTRGRGHLDRALKDPDERRAMAWFLESGLIDKSQAHDLAGVGETGVEYNALHKRVMNKIGWFFHQSERFNREVTAMAAYRLARAEGLGHEAALRRATDLTYSIHFDYSAANRPRVMQNDAA
jgi:diguanylate cyclase (GGDEF)-like protein